MSHNFITLIHMDNHIKTIMKKSGEAYRPSWVPLLEYNQKKVFCRKRYSGSKKKKVNWCTEYACSIFDTLMSIICREGRYLGKIFFSVGAESFSVCTHVRVWLLACVPDHRQRALAENNNNNVFSLSSSYASGIGGWLSRVTWLSLSQEDTARCWPRPQLSDGRPGQGDLRPRRVPPLGGRSAPLYGVPSRLRECPHSVASGISQSGWSKGSGGSLAACNVSALEVTRRSRCHILLVTRGPPAQCGSRLQGSLHSRWQWASWGHLGAWPPWYGWSHHMLFLTLENILAEDPNFHTHEWTRWTYTHTK